jgi:hypothetical protein
MFRPNVSDHGLKLDLCVTSAVRPVPNRAAELPAARDHEWPADQPPLEIEKTGMVVSLVASFIVHLLV